MLKKKKNINAALEKDDIFVSCCCVCAQTLFATGEPPVDVWLALWILVGCVRIQITHLQSLHAHIVLSDMHNKLVLWCLKKIFIFLLMFWVKVFLPDFNLLYERLAVCVLNAHSHVADDGGTCCLRANRLATAIKPICVQCCVVGMIFFLFSGIIFRRSFICLLN